MQTLTVEPRQVSPPSLDRRLYAVIHGLPHSPAGDRYIALLSDLGEGLGQAGAGVALVWLGDTRGKTRRRAGRAGIGVASGR
jgi:hypothetical protein